MGSRRANGECRFRNGFDSANVFKALTFGSGA
jgi:hypothetical protein